MSHWAAELDEINEKLKSWRDEHAGYCPANALVDIDQAIQLLDCATTHKEVLI